MASLLEDSAASLEELSTSSEELDSGELLELLTELEDAVLDELSSSSELEELE